MKLVYTLIISLLLTGPVYAQPGQGLGLEAGGAVAEQINLTAEQTEALKCDNPGQGRVLKEKILREKEILNESIRDKEVSDEEILSQLEIINELQAQFNRFKLEKILRARKVLTEEQLEKLAELKKNKPEHQHEESSHP